MEPRQRWNWLAKVTDISQHDKARVVQRQQTAQQTEKGRDREVAAAASDFPLDPARLTLAVR